MIAKVLLAVLAMLLAAILGGAVLAIALWEFGYTPEEIGEEGSDDD